VKTFVNKYRVMPSSEISVRFKSTSKMVKRYGLFHPSLDAGGPNPFAESICVERCLDKDCNLNEFWSVPGKFYTITSFEVIEHLQNPLLYLDCIHSHLYVGGKLLLTTPVKWMFKGKYHFHEFTKEELLFCLIEAGFDEEQILITRIQAYTLKHFGIRPIIKKIRDMIYGQCFFVIAMK